MPADDAVAVWLDAYRPDAVPAPVWDGGLSEFVADLVKELDVGLDASKRYARVLASTRYRSGLIGERYRKCSDDVGGSPVFNGSPGGRFSEN